MLYNGCIVLVSRKPTQPISHSTATTSSTVAVTMSETNRQWSDVVVIINSQTIYRWCTVVSGHWNTMNPRSKMSHEGTARVRHFQPRVIILQCRTNDHASRFVVWPTTNLKLYIVFWNSGETWLSIVCHLKMHTYLITVRGQLYVLIRVL